MFKPKRRIAERPGPLVFNEIYGKGLAMSGDSRQVTRLSGFGDAIVFSNRRVRSTEKIFLRHRQKNVDWIGSLRIGFCVEDPKTKFTRETLPNLAFKNLSESDGYYLRACSDELLQNSPIIYVYYSFDGQIHIGAYGKIESDQVVLTISNHSGPFFFFCEVYGKTDQIEIIDDTTLPDQYFVRLNSTLNNFPPVSQTVNDKIQNNGNLLQLHNFRYLFPRNESDHLSFVKSRNHNILTLLDRRIACVDDTSILASYAFVSTPIKPGEVLVCRVLDCQLNTSARLLFGLMTIDPGTIKHDVLPIDSFDLHQKYSSGEWFIESDIESDLDLFDELAFYLDERGRVQLSINNKPSFPLNIDVPSSSIRKSTFYPFFDLYGQVTSICLFKYAKSSDLSFGQSSNGLTVCRICQDGVADSRLIPCQCLLCNKCASILKCPGSLADCPFDRTHIIRYEKIF